MRSAWQVLLVMFLLISPVYADSVATEPGSTTFDQGQLAYLRDPTREMSLDQARAAQAAGQFKPLQHNLGLGFIPDTVWLHLSVERLPGQFLEGWLEVMPPYLDAIRLFHIRPDRQIDERRGGDFLPQSAKEEDYRGTLFKVQLQPGPHEFYLRIQTTSTMAAIVTLWQPAAFANHLRSSYFAFGLYFSLILTVLLFNAANWLVSRRPVFLVYVGYLSLNALQWLAINGFVAEFIFTSQPLLANLTLGMALSLSGAMAFVFYIFILEQKRYHPYLYRFSQIGIVASVATAIATPLGYYSTFAPLLLLFGVVALLTIPWPTRRLWKTGDLWARLLAVAYVSYGALLSINILGALSILPFNQWNIYAGMASNICHILLLHFGILLHYRRIEAAHAAAIEKSALAERQATLEKTYREDQDKLLAMITHEIRTPIAVIDAATQTLEALDEKPSADREERYERIRRSVNRLGVLLELAVAQGRPNVADWQLAQELIEPRQLTQAVVELLGNPLARRIQVEEIAPPPVIVGDDRMLRFALLNLLDNACKYSPPDSPVQVALSAESNGVAWRVEDKGPGIPAGMEEKIFDKYVRVGEAVSQGGKAGLGLGLYLARYIVERHGGKLTVETARREGACFVCWLPANEQEEAT